MTIKERFKELISQKYYDVKFYEDPAPKTPQESLTVHFIGFTEPFTIPTLTESENITRVFGSITRVAGQATLPPFDVEEMSFDYAKNQFDKAVKLIDESIKKNVLT